MCSSGLPAGRRKGRLGAFPGDLQATGKIRWGSGHPPGTQALSSRSKAQVSRAPGGAGSALALPGSDVPKEKVRVLVGFTFPEASQNPGRKPGFPKGNFKADKKEQPVARAQVPASEVR